MIQGEIQGTIDRVVGGENLFILRFLMKIEKDIDY